MLSSSQPKLEALVAPVVDPQRCRACRKCPAREACRPKAILRVDRDEPPFVDPRRCLGCRACLVACPFQALRVGSGA